MQTLQIERRDTDDPFVYELVTNFRISDNCRNLLGRLGGNLHNVDRIDCQDQLVRIILNRISDEELLQVTLVIIESSLYHHQDGPATD